MTDNENKKPSFLQVMLSAMAAAFGVQSEKARQRDFQQKNIMPYIVAGILFTVLFIITLIFVVKLVLSTST